MSQKRQSLFDGIQHPKKRAFLAAYAHLGLITRAARAAQIDRTTHFIWIKEDPDYAAAFEEARQIAHAALEDSAIQRARYGIDKPVFHQGKICGYVREYSDTLLIFALKGAMPDKYRERASFEHTGKDGKPLMDVATARALLHSFDDDTA